MKRNHVNRLLLWPVRLNHCSAKMCVAVRNLLHIPCSHLFRSESKTYKNQRKTKKVMNKKKGCGGRGVFDNALAMCSRVSVCMRPLYSNKTPIISVSWKRRVASDNYYWFGHFWQSLVKIRQLQGWVYDYQRFEDRPIIGSKFDPLLSERSKKKDASE